MLWLKTVAVVAGVIVAGCADSEREFRVDICPMNTFSGLTVSQAVDSIGCVTNVSEEELVAETGDLDFAFSTVCKVEAGTIVKELYLEAANSTNYCIWAVESTNGVWRVVGDIQFHKDTQF